MHIPPESHQHRPDEESASPDPAANPPENLASPSSDSGWFSSELLPLVYAELRRLAAAKLAREPQRGAGFTLQPTALVHEAFIRLSGPDDAQPRLWNTKAHFFAAAAESMRRILIERARRQIRRDALGKREPITMSELTANTEAPPIDILELDRALVQLREHDVRKYDVVMLRFFAGVSVEQTASLLHVSEMTVKRDWVYARAWLLSNVSGSQELSQPPTDLNSSSSHE